MVWNYSGDPGSSDRDAIRFLIGDTDELDPLIQDEEIAWVLLENPDVRLAGAVVLRALAAKLSRQGDKRVGEVSESASQMAEAFSARADELESQAMSLALPSFGGLSISEKETLDEDTDAVQPSFRIGQDDHPEIPSEREYSPYRTWED